MRARDSGALGSRDWVGLSVLVALLAASGCGSHTRRVSVPVNSGQPLGIATRPAGYASYSGCLGCERTVPTTLRRPLHLPRSATPCPVTSPHRPHNRVEGRVLGIGPVFAGADVGNRYPLQPPPSAAAGRWGYFKILWSVRAYRGPFLIRGHEIGGSGGLGFGDPELAPLHELQIAPGEAGTPPPTSPGDLWRFFPSSVRVVATGCYGLQVDGTSFSEVIVIRVVAK